MKRTVSRKTRRQKHARELPSRNDGLAAVPARSKISTRIRWTIYGVLVGLTIVVADLLFQWRGPQFEPWVDDGVVRNIGQVLGTAFVGGVFGFIVGIFKNR
jgi:hypothetical protein